MKLKVSSFKEAELGKDFAKDKLADFKRLIDLGNSFVVLSMPGVGVSYFLKFLTTQNFAHFIYVDIYSLPSLNQHEFYRMFLRELGGNPDGKSDEQVFIETKKIIKTLAEKFPKLVVIFSRFDQLQDNFDANFLSNLQALTTIYPNSPRPSLTRPRSAGEAGKVVLIFTSTRPLYDIAPAAVSGGNLNFYSESLYFTPYSKEDLQELIKIEPPRPTPKPVLEKLIELSGGHNQLLQILRRSQKQQNLILDQFVKLQLKELVDYLSYQQKKCLQKIAMGKTVTEVDEYLLGVGMVKNSKSKDQKSKFELFTPLLTEYIKQNIAVKLPVKESKLFKLLRKHLGDVVTKDEIFLEVWGEDQQNATDWALDALIYRLRKHPFLQSQGYIIESQKKVGYTLIQT